MKSVVGIACIALLGVACSGDDGKNGVNGHNALVSTTDEAPGANCTYGGKKVSFGTDDNGDGTLGDDEVIYTDYRCQSTQCDLRAGGKCAGADLRNISIIGPNDGGIFGGGSASINSDGDLRSIDLSNADLSGALLIGVDFSNANLTGVKLDNALIVQTVFFNNTFTGASMKGTVFLEQAAIVGGDMTNVDASGSFWVSGAGFAGTIAHGLKLDGAFIEDQIFIQQADFTGASFVGAHMTGTDLEVDGSNFTNASFNGADLNGTVWSASPAATMTGATFAGASLFDANLTALDLSGIGSYAGAFSNSPGTTFTGFDPSAHGGIIVQESTSFASVDFSKAWFTVNVDFKGCTLTGAKFDGRHINNNDFTGANLTGASFNGAFLGSSNLTNANLTSADFTGADLSDATFATTTLTSAKFVRANLTGVSLNGLAAGGADFTHATLIATNANVTGASTATWTGAFKNGATTLAGDVPASAAFVTVQPGTSGAGADLSGIWLDANNANVDAFTFTSADNFSNANFTNARVTGATFDGANLSSANLTGALIVDTHFVGTNLTSANLTNAKLLECEMSNANMTGANLTGALTALVDLVGVNATNANLTNASLACSSTVANVSGPVMVAPTNFTGATMSNTTCPDFAVEPAGSAANACSNHAILLVPSTEFGVYEITRCEVYAELVLVTTLL